LDTDTHREEGCVKAEAEIGSDVAANQGVPRIAGDHQKPRRDEKTSFPRAWRGNMVLLTP